MEENNIVKAEIVKPMSAGLDPATGKFAKGNKLGKGGNPYCGKIQDLKKALYEATTPEDIVSVWNAIKRRALKGSTADSKLFLAYTIGEPKQEIEAKVINMTLEEVEERINSIFGLKKEQNGEA